MLSKKLLLIIFLPICAFSQKPYDTSTPEKFVESMGLVGEQPKSHNPIPFFYEKKAAKAMNQFDESGLNAMKSFDAFRNSVAEKFPKHILVNEEGYLKVVLDDVLDKNNRDFSFSATLIGEQLKERDPSDYEFISSTEPDEEKSVQLTLKISGNERTLPLTKTKKGFRMVLGENVLADIEEMISKTEQFERIFSEANRQLAKGDITEANFAVKIDELSMKYAQALE